MVFYECEFCNFSSIYKNDFNRHLNTKKHINNVKDYEDGKLKNLKKGLKKDSSVKKRTQKGLKKDSKRTQNPDFCEKKNFECEFCKIKLKNRPILLRHLRKYCKVKKEMEEEQKIKDNLIQEQKKQIDKLIDKIGTNTTITNIDSSSYNTTNIQLNNYNSVDLSMLTDNFKSKMINGPYTMIPRAMKAIYFNKKYPQNKVLKLVNRKDNIMQVHKKNGWEYVEKETVIDEIIDNTNYEIDIYYEKTPEKFNEFVNKTYKRFRDLYETQDKKLWNDIKKQVDLLLWNNM
jgi:hypothetical protein|uniref:C2H2-type domain-containing protein n=1 Tax=Mimiviridae sp. ChoanoV1 TaxID=2596887 RepID=A0A5B8HWH5_9VIRU|nr:hypothetical protein 3_82 [Mimiviridae sp. ChoanoV1]